MKKIFIFLLNLCCPLVAVASPISIYCNPKEIISSNTAYEDIFSGSCYQYEKEREGTDCMSFELHFDTTGDTAIKFIAVDEVLEMTERNRLQYKFSSSNEEIGLHFDLTVRRDNLSFEMIESMSLELPGMPKIGYANQVTGACGIMKETRDLTPKI